MRWITPQSNNSTEPSILLGDFYHSPLRLARLVVKALLVPNPDDSSPSSSKLTIAQSRGPRRALLIDSMSTLVQQRLAWNSREIGQALGLV
jgi:hypothetical protein